MDVLDALTQQLAQGSITRRQFVKQAGALGLSASAVGMFLAACGSGSGGGASASPTPMSTAKPDKLFLNFLHDPMNAAEISNYIGYQSGNLAAQPYITDPIQKGMRPSTETLKKGHFRMDLGAFSRNYDDAWAKVKSA